MASKWNEIEKWMEGQQLPKGFEILKEPDWVEQYVRKLMTKALPEAAGAITGSKSAAVSETENFVVVKINLPKDTVREQVRLFIREDRVRVEGLPKGSKETVKLPVLVKPRICKAQVKDDVLHVKLRKRPINRSYHESYIVW
ncbi:Hsp20/alpha crystallin family protein [Paenibacillus harenae]|uniref:HSP20 family molecular chaperone IbpA n=1 Tax=Paenibacillus harenae TaxID=306543 RepID=A0ABT9TY41_PAEHA|nr:Hsp20/alpha crystallin family protein [Paenibacillus harenae]MDQ0058323.1 HSP20 family molecular chaperone IbpA [Paenibacillus harenae]MDQ0111668.1 HSP20 family molecular chaperone IbpA [Paenibacillus harenae]